MLFTQYDESPVPADVVCTEKHSGYKNNRINLFVFSLRRALTNPKRSMYR